MCYQIMIVRKPGNVGTLEVMGFQLRKLQISNLQLQEAFGHQKAL